MKTVYVRTEVASFVFDFNCASITTLNQNTFSPTEMAYFNKSLEMKCPVIVNDYMYEAKRVLVL